MSEFPGNFITKIEDVFSSSIAKAPYSDIVNLNYSIPISDLRNSLAISPFSSIYYLNPKI